MEPIYLKMGRGYYCREFTFGAKQEVSNPSAGLDRGPHT